MYATMRIYAGKSALADELKANQESVKNVMSAVPGFQAYYFVSTPDGGGASFTVCDDQAGAAASTAAAAAWIVENLPGASAAPTIHAGEVVVAF